MTRVVRVAEYEVIGGRHKDVFVATQWSGTPSNCAPDEHDDLSWFTMEQAKVLTVAETDCLPFAFTARGDGGRV